MTMAGSLLCAVLANTAHGGIHTSRQSCVTARGLFVPPPPWPPSLCADRSRFHAGQRVASISGPSAAAAGLGGGAIARKPLRALKAAQLRASQQVCWTPQVSSLLDSLRDPSQVPTRVKFLLEDVHSPIQHIDDPFLEAFGVQLSLKRDDLIHPEISGNKWRKLKYNALFAAVRSQAILTFGGAFSNHISATAAVGKLRMPHVPCALAASTQNLGIRLRLGIVSARDNDEETEL